MARTATFNNKMNRVKAMKNLTANSSYLNHELVKLGFVVIEPVKTGSRGRPAYNFVLSGKGRGYLALAKNWHKSAI